MVLVHRAVLFGFSAGLRQHPVEVNTGEDSVVGSPVVPCFGLEVVQVSEAGGVGVSEPEGPPSVAVVNCIAVLSLHEFKNVILNDRGLTHGSCLGAGSFTRDAIAHCENVLMFVVLEGVPVDINTTTGISETALCEPRVWLALRVNAS